MPVRLSVLFRNSQLIPNRPNLNPLSWNEIQPIVPFIHQSYWQTRSAITNRTPSSDYVSRQEHVSIIFQALLQPTTTRDRTQCLNHSRAGSGNCQPRPTRKLTKTRHERETSNGPRINYLSIIHARKSLGSEKIYVVVVE